MSLRPVFLVAVAGLSALGACQDSRKPVPEVVLKALAAARTLKYSGTRTVAFREGSQMRTHVEHVLKDGPRSRIWFPPGSPNHGSVIVENGPKRFQYLPNPGRVIETPARSDDALKRLAATVRNASRFRVRAAKGGLVAGMPTQRADILDRSGGKVQSLWIEPGSGMVLKRELYDKAGNIVGSYEFTSVNFNPEIRRGDFEINRNARQVRLQELLAELCERHGFEPMILAEGQGYKLRAVRVLNPTSKMPVLMQSYFGPSGVLTLFQVNGEINPNRLSRLAGGRASAHSWKARGKTLVLIGEADQAELAKLSGFVGTP